MTEDEIAEAIKKAYLEGLKEGQSQALMEKYCCGAVTAANELAELYTQTFFVKQTLDKGKKFFRR